MNKSLSLCVIAKDAEKDLANCLNSVKGLVDQIILIDTGSSDNTKSIARLFGAKIYDYVWNDNFADARNFSLEKVNTDWVLILDTDETFVGDKDTINKIINQDYQEKIPMYFIDILTYTKENFDNYDYYQKKIRLFPKSNNILFENIVSEEIIHPQGTLNLLGLNAKGLAIKHFLKEGPKSKSKRNVLMLKKQLKKTPDSFYYNYLMGKECLQHNLFNKAFSCYQVALDSNDKKDDIYLSEICTDIIKILYRQGEKEEALNECLRREKICQNNPDFWLTYGYLVLREGDLETARDSFKKCLDLDPPAHLIMISIENITWKPEMMLGYTYLRLKDYENARIYLEKSLGHKDNQWLLLYYLGITCKNLKDYNASETYFKAAELLVPEEYQQELKFSILLMHIMNGKFDKANDIVKSMFDDFDMNENEELSLVDYDIFD